MTTEISGKLAQLPTWRSIAKMSAAVSAGPAGWTRAQVVAVLTPYLLRRLPDDALKACFDALDRQRLGYVSRSDWAAAVQEVSPHLSTLVTEQAFVDLDRQCYGKLTLRQFTASVKHV